MPDHTYAVQLTVRLAGHPADGRRVTVIRRLGDLVTVEGHLPHVGPARWDVPADSIVEVGRARAA